MTDQRYNNTLQIFIAVIAIFAFIYTTSDYLILKESSNLENMVYGNQTTIFNYTLQDKQNLVSYHFLDNVTKPLLFIIFSFVLFWSMYIINSSYLFSKKWIFSITNGILFFAIIFYLIPYSYLIFRVDWLIVVNNSMILFFPKMFSFLLFLFYILMFAIALINKFKVNKS